MFHTSLITNIVAWERRLQVEEEKRKNLHISPEGSPRRKRSGGKNQPVTSPSYKPADCQPVSDCR